NRRKLELTILLSDESSDCARCFPRTRVERNLLQNKNSLTKPKQMKHLLLASLITSASLVCSHAAEVGKAAPDFSVKDLNDKTVSLKAFEDKLVVLEWNHFDCPF